MDVALNVRIVLNSVPSNILKSVSANIYACAKKKSPIHFPVGYLGFRNFPFRKIKRVGCLIVCFAFIQSGWLSKKVCVRCNVRAHSLEGIVVLKQY